MIFSGWALVVFIVFCTVVSIQLFYYWYFFARVSYFKEKEKTVAHTHPVSVIICARDEASNLINNIPAILCQNYPYTNELIIVNDNSYDDTIHVIEQFKKEYKHINAIHLTEEAKFLQGKKFPLSMGIKAAKYELLLLTDADCTPASDQWMHDMQSHFDDGIDIVLGYGPYKKRKGFLNKVIRFETFHTALQYLSYSLAGVPYMGVGRNLAYKKLLYNSVKGFTSHSNIPSGDDDLFINQVATSSNVAVSLNPSTFTYSRPKKTWEEWRKQKQRHLSTGKYYKPLHKVLLGAYSFTQTIFYPLLIAVLLLSIKSLIALAIIGGIFILRLISLIIVWFGAMNKLNEKDLKPYFWLWDLWLPIYFLRFFPTLFKKVQKQWK